MARLPGAEAPDITPEVLDAVLEKVADRMWSEMRPAILRRQGDKVATRAAEEAAGNVTPLRRAG